MTVTQIQQKASGEKHRGGYYSKKYYTKVLKDISIKLQFKYWARNKKLKTIAI